MRPSILVLDEPTAGLDPQSETHMIELLLRLNRQEKITLIFATHCVDLLPVLATRIYVLRQGRVHREGPPETVLADAWATAEAGLRLPLIAQLFHELDGDGMSAGRLPLTVQQARRQIRQWVAQTGNVGVPGERT